MGLRCICKKCKKVYSYNWNDLCKTCKIDLEEVYICDRCGLILDEDDIHYYEKGIECFEYCIVCVPK